MTRDSLDRSRLLRHVGNVQRSKVARQEMVTVRIWKKKITRDKGNPRDI